MKKIIPLLALLPTVSGCDEKDREKSPLNDAAHKGGVIISEAGPENSKDGGKMSLNDGIKVGGVFMPVAGFR
ncbi:MAG: hypothetical protein LBL21_02535, partial [Rickettsiales bacterium]|nr:hypothetical protein [Rickettsiales bacterium]